MSSNKTTNRGIVVEALPNTQFRIETPDGKLIRAYLSGKMKLNRINVLLGDVVDYVPDTQGDNNRIVSRGKKL